MDEIQATESVVGTDNPSVALGDTSPYTGEADGSVRHHRSSVGAR